MIWWLQLLGLAQKYWKVLLAVGIGLAVFGVLVWAFHAHGEAQFKAGQLYERAEWQQKLGEAQARASRAEEELTRTRNERDLLRAERDEARRRSLVTVTREIQDAPNFEARYAAYLSHRVSLRESRAQRLARARIDYLSSLTPE